MDELTVTKIISCVVIMWSTVWRELGIHFMEDKKLNSKTLTQKVKELILCKLPLFLMNNFPNHFVGICDTH